MTEAALPTYDPTTTALLLVDPYNDFFSEGGKLWPRAKAIAEEVGLLDDLRAIVVAARATVRRTGYRGA